MIFRRLMMVFLLMLASVATLGGCVERIISITSQPSSALVYLNDVEVGRTPLEVQFLHYGVYDVRLEAQGYKPLWTKQEAKTPLWDQPGIDLFAEAIPGTKSHISWHFEMEPAEATDADRLIDRAGQMRSLVTQEAGNPQQQAAEPAPSDAATKDE